MQWVKWRSKKRLGGYMQAVLRCKEAIGFGMFGSCTPEELLKSKRGTKYLSWMFHNTQVQFEVELIRKLHTHGVIVLSEKARKQYFKGASMSDKQQSTHNTVELESDIEVERLTDEQVELRFTELLAIEFDSINRLL